MGNKQRKETQPSRNTGRTRAATVARIAACPGLALAVAGIYLGLYRVRGFRVPVGFDAPWYVWRAAFVAEHGLGPVGTSARPGSAVLAAYLSGVTGRTPFEIAVLLGPVLAGVFAIALGALTWSAIGPGRRRWLCAVVLGGTVLGATRLVDENVATLLFLCVAVAACVPMVAAASGAGRGWGREVAAAIALLVAGGLTHQLFLAVFALMLLGAIGFVAPGSIRQRAEGTPVVRTEAGTLATVVLGAGAAMAIAIVGVLRTPASTIQVREDPARFVPKLANDASRLRAWLLGPFAAFGAWVLAAGGGRPRPRPRAIGLALLCAWALVASAGVVFGLVTRRLPPHRFFELVVVVPGVLACAGAVGWIGHRVRRRSGVRIAWLAAVSVTVVLSIPGVAAWYGAGGPKPWLDPVALRQLSVVAAWSETLPAGRSFVVLVAPQGTAGVESPALKERTVRAALPPDRQSQAHVFVGTFDDLVAGRRPTTPNPAMDAAILPYWEDVEPLLASDPPVAFVAKLAPQDLAAVTRRAGVEPLGSGAWVFRGGAPANAVGSFAAVDPPSAFPGVIGSAFWAAIVLLVLSGVGIGWTVALVGPGAPAPVVFGLAPGVGAASLIVTGTVLSRFGVPLAGPFAVLAMTVAGPAIGIVLGRRRAVSGAVDGSSADRSAAADRPGPPGPDPSGT